jgi:tRNA pseudouridine55 synthase
MPQRPEGPTGILLIHKAAGWTSHDVVAKARRLTGQRRIGHTGTLDPMATGLLVLCLGRATRLVEYMTAHDKRYEGVIRLGVRTETDDAEGAVIAEAPVPALMEERLRELEAQFSGPLQQRPPAYSAIKVGGERAYAAARRGDALDLPARPVEVHSIDLTVRDDSTLSVAVHCGPGTYIRSIARDIGEALGCGGHLTALSRTSVGAFSLFKAVSLAELEQVCSAGMLDELLLPADEGMLDADAAILGEEHAGALLHGIRVVTGAVEAANPVRLYDTAGTFIGTGSIEESGELRPLKVLSGG